MFKWWVKPLPPSTPPLFRNLAFEEQPNSVDLFVFSFDTFEPWKRHIGYLLEHLHCTR